jgi:branched-chain amino acid transport system ATP-binding protein
VNRLRIEALDAGYGAVTVLRDVSFEVREGELVALLGMNGNGKSTLLNCLMGYIRPTAGRILLDWDGETHDLAALRPHAIVNLGIGYVPEGRRLAANLTVEENLVLAGSAPRARGDRAANLGLALDTFPVLAERRRQPASTLSGGQQQMLAIARTLMTAPRIMVVDEPSVGLAPIMVSQVLAVIRHLQQTRGLTVLMAEQSFFQAIEIASCAHVLTHGRITHSFDQALDATSADAIRRAMLGVA